MACRPWFLAISGSMVLQALVASNYLGYAFDLYHALLILLVIILMHSGTQTANSYFDYVYGCDTKEAAYNRGLFEGGITLSEMKIFTIALYGVACLAGWLQYEAMQRDARYICYFLLLFITSISYTAKPMALKYRYLGDLNVFVTFGPLLIGSVFLTQSRSSAFWLPLSFAAPTLFGLEAGLVANYWRDVKEDYKAGVRTIPQLIGAFWTFIIYATSIFGMPISSVLLAYYWNNYWFLAGLVMLPQGFSLVSRWRKKDMKNLPISSAKYNFIYTTITTCAMIIDSVI
jgi:1,4-dihydroxy-2-naphthoate octaprenyltransferase